MPTIQQLPSASTTSTTDQIPVSQSGTTRAVTVGALLAAAQPAITVQSEMLLGRVSLGPGGPEAVTPGTGLAMQSGTLAANGTDHSSFLLETKLSLTDNVVLDSSGTPTRLPLTGLRSLFSAGKNVSIDQNGTISATGTGSTLALPASAPLLSSNGTSLTAVALGSNLALTAGTLSATGTGSTLVLPASAPLLSSNGTSLTAVALGSNLALTAGTLSATGTGSALALPANAPLLSSNGTSLTAVALGSNLALTAGTLSATGTGSTLALPASAPLLSSNGTSLTAVALGSNLALTGGTLSASAPSVPTSAALLASTAQGALSPVAVSGASYTNGTLSVPSYKLPAATTSALGGVRGDGSTVSISSLGVISATGTGTVSGTSPVTPTGAPNPVTLANLAARIVYVEDYGAVADCLLTGDGSTVISATDNGPAFQAAINALGTGGGIVQLSVGHYWVNTPVTLNQGTVVFQGKGYYEGAGPNSGTWLIQSNATPGFHLLSITRSNGIGSVLQNFAIHQCHPSPSTTAGTAWTPTNYDYAIYFTNLYGGFTVSRVFLGSVNKGIGLFYCGHFKLDEITGQCYTTGVWIDACQDSPRIGHMRFWTYQDNNINRRYWQQQNFDALVLGRCDGIYIDGTIFAFAARAVVHCVMGATTFVAASSQNTTAETMPGSTTVSIPSGSFYVGEQVVGTGIASGTTITAIPDANTITLSIATTADIASGTALQAGAVGPGGPPQFQFNNLSGDQVAYGIWLDKLTNAGTIILVQGGNLYCNNIDVRTNSTPLNDGGTTVARSQGWCIYSDSSNVVHVQIANVVTHYTWENGIYWSGNTATLQIGTLFAYAFNFCYGEIPVPANAPPVAGAIYIGDNGGTGYNNVVSVGSYRLFNGHGGPLFTIGLNANGATGTGKGWGTGTAADNYTGDYEINVDGQQVVTATPTTFNVNLTSGQVIQGNSTGVVLYAGNKYVLRVDQYGTTPDSGLLVRSELGRVQLIQECTGTETGGIGIYPANAGIVGLGGPVYIQEFALSSLPTAANFRGTMIWVNGITTANVSPLAYCDGTNWRFLTNNAIVA